DVREPPNRRLLSPWRVSGEEDQMSAFWNTFLLDYPNLINAAILTIGLALVAGVIAMVIAIPVGFGRLSRVTIIRSLSTTYVEVVRGTPLLLQLLVWFYGVRILLLTVFQ